MQTCLPELGEHQMRADQQDLLPIAVISYESAHPLPSPHSHPTHIYTRNTSNTLERHNAFATFSIYKLKHIKLSNVNSHVQTITITVVTKKVSLNFIYIYIYIYIYQMKKKTLIDYLISCSFSLFHQLMINKQTGTRNPQLNK